MSELQNSVQQLSNPNSMVLERLETLISMQVDRDTSVQFDTCASAVDARNLETRASSAAYRRGMVGQFSILSDALSSG